MTTGCRAETEFMYASYRAGAESWTAAVKALARYGHEVRSWRLLIC